jgi:hypothetical protein
MLSRSLATGSVTFMPQGSRKRRSVGQVRAFTKPTTYAWRTKSEYVTLLHVVLRTCTVAVRDLRDVEHSIEVTAETLYEAIATALAALQQDNWVGEIGQGPTTVRVLVQQPPVRHEVQMKDFLAWLARQGRSPAEVFLKQKLAKILDNGNQRRR